MRLQFTSSQSHFVAAARTALSLNAAAMAVAPPQQSSEAEAVQDQRGLLDKIEDFCSMPDFTDSISDFAAQHSQEFATGPIEGEHPVRHAAYRRTAHCRHDSCQCTSRQLRWHELYLQYTALIEGKLEAFLKEQGVPVAAMLSAARWLSARWVATPRRFST